MKLRFDDGGPPQEWWPDAVVMALEREVDLLRQIINGEYGLDNRKRYVPPVTDPMESLG